MTQYNTLFTFFLPSYHETEYISDKSFKYFKKRAMCDAYVKMWSLIKAL